MKMPRSTKTNQKELLMILIIGESSFTDLLKDPLTILGYNISIARDKGEALLMCDIMAYDAWIIDKDLFDMTDTEFVERLMIMEDDLPILHMADKNSATVISINHKSDLICKHIQIPLNIYNLHIDLLNDTEKKYGKRKKLSVAS